MNTINTKVQQLQQQKETLDARIAKLEELEDSTTPVKNLLVSLLADYATEALEELPIIWEEILAIGQQHGLSVQPLAADELREWETTNAEHQTLKQEYEVTKRQYLELLEISAKQIKELQCELEKEKYNYSTLIVIDKQLNQELENFRQQSKICSEYEQITGEDASTLSATECQRQLKLWYEGGLTWNYPEYANNEIKKLQAECEQVKREYLELINATATDAIEIKKLRSQLPQVQPNSEPKVWRKGEIAPELKNFYQETLTETDFEATLTDKEYDAAVEEELALDGDGTTAIYEEVSAASLEPEYEPEEASDTVESVLKAKGFFQPNDLEDYDSNEKHETYRGWDIYYGVPNGGIVLIGLYNTEYNQPWDASTEYIQEIDSTFPESLADFDEIVKWTQALIDQVENVKAPGQLSLEFLESTSEQEDKKEVTPEQTELQKLLAGNSLIDRILISHGFFMPDMKIDDQYSEDEKYEDYQGWVIYRQSHDRGVTGIGLYHEKFGFWDASTEMINEDDATFPEDFSDGDAILTWLRSVIDEVVAITPVENSEVPGQLSLEFPDTTSEQIEEELGCNWEDEEETAPEQTKLQKLLADNSNFTFEELGVSVKIQSVFTEEEIESEDKDKSNDPATEKVEEALIIACNAEGRHWRYYVNAQTFIYQYIDSLEQAALGYAQYFLRDLEKQAKAKKEITQWNAENAQQ